MEKKYGTETKKSPSPSFKSLVAKTLSFQNSKAKTSKVKNDEAPDGTRISNAFLRSSTGEFSRFEKPADIIYITTAPPGLGREGAARKASPSKVKVRHEELRLRPFPPLGSDIPGLLASARFLHSPFLRARHATRQQSPGPPHTPLKRPRVLGRSLAWPGAGRLVVARTSLTNPGVVELPHLRRRVQWCWKCRGAARGRGIHRRGPH